MSETEKASVSREAGGNVVVVNEEANKNEVSIEAQKKGDRVDFSLTMSWVAEMLKRLRLIVKGS